MPVALISEQRGRERERHETGVAVPAIIDFLLGFLTATLTTTTRFPQKITHTIIAHVGVTLYWHQ